MLLAFVNFEVFADEPAATFLNLDIWLQPSALLLKCGIYSLAVIIDYREG